MVSCDSSSDPTVSFLFVAFSALAFDGACMIRCLSYHFKATTFDLTFRGQTTDALSGNSSATDIQAALESLWSIGSVDVVITTGSVGCAVGGSTFEVRSQDFNTLLQFDALKNTVF